MDATTWTLAPVTPAFRVTRLTLWRAYDGSDARIDAEVSDGANQVVWQSTGPDALALLGQLNAANFSAKPLHQVMLERLAALGVLKPGVAA